jgi:hypothetical protein
MRKPGDITWTAIVDAEELVIREARYAGVDGPIYSAEFDGQGRPDLGDVDEMLAAQGFTRTGRDWVLVKAYDGLRLEVTLDRL